MDNLLPTANPILRTPFEFVLPKYDYPGEIAPMPYFHHHNKPPKDILNFECCDIDFFQKEPTCYKSLHELHFNALLIYQRFVTQTQKNFASPNYQATQLYSRGPVHFNSNFECGNLYSVYRVADKKYNLVLHNDTQTNGCTRWYFFSVRTPERMMLQLNIINLSKHASHLSVNPYIYTPRTGWYRGGENVQYYKNHYENKQDYYYTLSFSYLFEKDETHYFSLYPPYGVTTLQTFLQPLTHNNFVKLKAISGNGNQHPVITIGNAQKPLIVIIARQHPSEVVTSYVTEGIIRFLTSEEGAKLREQFYFKILPMMNPDGVIHGNSRANLQGIDMNQKWHKVNKQVPSVQHVKAILKKAASLNLVLDLHQTFKKYGVSFIGKYDKNSSFISAATQTCPYINLEQSKFGKSTKMEKTLPFALGDLLNVNCIYQVRISDQAASCKDFTIPMLRQIGTNLCQAIVLANQDINLESPQLQQCLDISASESCDSCEETANKKKVVKKRMISTHQSNENHNVSIVASTITKKTVQTQKLKPLKPICNQYQTSNKKPAPSSQFKTRIRSFSTRTAEFNLKH